MYTDCDSQIQTKDYWNPEENRKKHCFSLNIYIYMHITNISMLMLKITTEF